MWYRLWTEYGKRIQIEVVDENIREFFRKWEKLMQEEATADPDGFHFNAHPLDKIYMDAFLDNISTYLRPDRATSPEGLNDYEQYEAEIAEANRLGISTRAVKIKWARFMDDHIGEIFRFYEDWWGVFTNTTNMLLHNKLKPIVHEEESSTYKLFSKYNFNISHIWKDKQTFRWDASFSPPDCKPPADGVFHVENAELPTWTKKL